MLNKKYLLSFYEDVIADRLLSYGDAEEDIDNDLEVIFDRLDDIEAQLRQMIKNQKYQQMHNEIVNVTLRRLEEDYRLRQNQEMGSRKNNASAKRSNKVRTTKKDN